VRDQDQSFALAQRHRIADVFDAVPFADLGAIATSQPSSASINPVIECAICAIVMTGIAGSLTKRMLLVGRRCAISATSGCKPIGGQKKRRMNPVESRSA
jgi:hypothetical protein